MKDGNNNLTCQKKCCCTDDPSFTENDDESNGSVIFVIFGILIILFVTMLHMATNSIFSSYKDGFPDDVDLKSICTSYKGFESRLEKRLQDESLTDLAKKDLLSDFNIVRDNYNRLFYLDIHIHNRIWDREFYDNYVEKRKSDACFDYIEFYPSKDFYSTTKEVAYHDKP